MAFIYDLSDTWNAGATTFTAIKMNVTDTASAAGSKLIDLQVGGTTRFDVDKNGQVEISAGTALLPSLATLGDANTGMWFPAADTIAWSTAGFERLRITSGGNVGIGTTTPGSTTNPALSGRLAVSGIAAAGTYNQSNNYSSAASLDTSGFVTNFAIPLYTGGTTVRAICVQYNSARLEFNRASNNPASGGVTQDMVIDSNGNVGIGTTAPDALLSVNGIASFGAGAAATPSIAGFGDLNTGMWFPAADTIAWSTGGSERMRINSSGNVGIGTSTLANKLNLFTNAAVSVGVNVSNSLVTWEAGVNSSGIYNIYSISAYPITFSNNALERMRIRSDGNVGIGTPFADTLLTVNGIASFGAGAVATPSVAAYGDLNTGMWFPAADTIAWSTNGGERLRITSVGNLGLGTSTFGTSAAVTLAIATGTAPTTGPADTIQIYSTDLTAGNTMLSLYTEGTIVNTNTTAATTHRIAIRVNGTVYYLLANTSAA